MIVSILNITAKEHSQNYLNNNVSHQKQIMNFYLPFEESYHDLKTLFYSYHILFDNHHLKSNYNTLQI